jgi:glycosyltransferase involved in cell wall biosynthesis
MGQGLRYDDVFRQHSVKIIQLLPALNTGGVERGTIELSQALVDGGHQSYVISGGGLLVSQLENEGGIHLTMPIGKKHIATLGCVTKLRQHILQIKPDILHVRSRIPAWVVYLACRLLPKRHRPLVVSTVHGLYSKPFYSQVMTFSDHIIAISQTVKDYLLTQYGVPEKKISLVYRGCDSKVFCRRPIDAQWRSQWFQQFPQTKGKRLLTLPARITKWKGVDTMLELISQLDNTYHALIVGPVDPSKQKYQEALNAIIRGKGLEKRITFCGRRNDIDEIYRLSSLVYNLSTHPEPFGRTVCEACNVGTKVISWRIGGPMESLLALFPEGLVEPGNLQALIDKTVDLVDRDDLIPKADIFTTEKTTTQTMRLYQGLCSEEMVAHEGN